MLHDGVSYGPIQGQGGSRGDDILKFFHYHDLSRPPFSIGAGK